MANPFFGNTQPPQQNVIPGLPEIDRSLPMDQALQKFASEFRGNPLQMISNLMMNGMMSQDRLKQLSNFAKMFGLIK